VRLQIRYGTTVQVDGVTGGGGAVAASLGTRYAVSSQQGKATITVLSGRVTVLNGGKSVSIGANQQSSIQGRTAPSAPKRVNAKSSQLSALSDLPSCFCFCRQVPPAPAEWLRM